MRKHFVCINTKPFVQSMVKPCMLQNKRCVYRFVFFRNTKPCAQKHFVFYATTNAHRIILHFTKNTKRCAQKNFAFSIITKPCAQKYFASFRNTKFCVKHNFVFYKIQNFVHTHFAANRIQNQLHRHNHFELHKNIYVSHKTTPICQKYTVLYSQ